MEISREGLNEMFRISSKHTKLAINAMTHTMTSEELTKATDLIYKTGNIGNIFKENRDRYLEISCRNNKSTTVVSAARYESMIILFDKRPNKSHVHFIGPLHVKTLILIITERSNIIIKRNTDVKSLGTKIILIHTKPLLCKDVIKLDGELFAECLALHTNVPAEFVFEGGRRNTEKSSSPLNSELAEVTQYNEDFTEKVRVTAPWD